MPEMPLWTPSSKRKQDSNLFRFKAGVEGKLKISLAGFEALHAWSVADSLAFWVELWDFCNIKAEYRGNRLVLDSDKLPDVRFFPDARLNYAQNLLIRDDDTPALIFRSEHKVRRSMSWKELQATVAELHHALAELGVSPGDRVAAMMPNMPETTALHARRRLARRRLVVLLARFRRARACSTASARSSRSVFIACDGYWYNGKPIDVADKVAAVSKQACRASSGWSSSTISATAEGAGGAASRAA